jgi:hypothetical protein
MLADFHRPQFRHLHYITLVVETKCLLLMTWDVTHTNKICIQPGKLIYRTPETAIICSLPTGTHAVRITLYNCWRSRKVQLPLKPIAIYPETLRYLDDRFLDKTKLANLTPAVKTKTPIIKTPEGKLAVMRQRYKALEDNYIQEVRNVKPGPRAAAIQEQMKMLDQQIRELEQSPTWHQPIFPVSVLLSAVCFGMAAICWLSCKEIIDGMTPKFIDFRS